MSQSLVDNIGGVLVPLNDPDLTVRRVHPGWGFFAGLEPRKTLCNARR
jgi:hypothetical protein